MEVTLKTSRHMESLHATLSELTEQQHQVRDDGPVAPANCWIDTYRPSGRETVYARLRCDRVLANGKRTQGLGRVGSSDHRDWQARIRRRNALQELERRAEAVASLADLPPVVW